MQWVKELTIKKKTLDTRRKSNVRKTFRKRGEHLLNVFFLFSFYSVYGLCPYLTSKIEELIFQWKGLSSFEVSVKIFTGKHLCWSLFLIKLQALRSATSLKRDSITGVFLWIFQIFYEQLFYRTRLVAASGFYEWHSLLTKM